MPDAMQNTDTTPAPEESLVRELGVLPIPGHRGWYDPKTGEVLQTLVPRKAYALSCSKNMWYVCLPSASGHRVCRSVGQLVALVFAIPKPSTAAHVVAIICEESGGLPVLENFAWHVKCAQGIERHPFKQPLAAD